MKDQIDGFNFQQKHGKERVRVGRVWRSQKDGRHYFVEWNVSIGLLSDCINAYVRADNSDIVATDTMKNTVPYLTLPPLFYFIFHLIQLCSSP